MGPMWTPVTSGDYSVWRDPLMAKIGKYCKEPLAMENGNTRFGNGAAKSLFDSMFSGRRAKGLRDALLTHKASKYVLSHGGNITLVVFGVLAFLLSVFLACCVSSGLRAKLSSCTGKRCCTDRQRRAPVNYKGFQTRMFAYKALVIISLLGMFCMSIVAFVYSAELITSSNSAACDFWQVSFGHYFGADTLKLAPGVVSDWMGTSPEWDDMSQFAQLLNPKPDGPDGTSRCVLCNAIENDFSGEDGVQNHLIDGGNQLQQLALPSVVLAETLQSAVSAARLPIQDGGDAGITVHAEDAIYPGPVYTAATAMSATVVNHLVDLQGAVAGGLQMFRDNLDSYLGRDSPLLLQGYETATTGIAALEDVNYVVAELVNSWDTSIWPALYGVVIAMVVIAVVMGVLALTFSIGGGAMFFYLQRETRENRQPPTSAIKAMGVSFSVLTILSGFAFLLCSILLLVGSIGSDVCAFADEYIFEKGDWDVFPRKMLQTYHNTTSIETVLDTCVKRSGDGDVAGSLGLKILLRRLEENVYSAKEDLLSKASEQLNVETRALNCDVAASNARLAGKNLYPPRQKFSFGTDFPKAKEHLGDQYLPKPVSVADAFSLSNGYARDDAVDSEFCGTRSLVRSQISIVLLLPITQCTDGLQVSVGSMKLALETLNKLAARQDPRGPNFCTKYTQLLGYCDDGANLIIDGSVTEAGGSDFIDNPFANAEVTDFFKQLSNKDDQTDFSDALVLFLNLVQFDGFNSWKIVDLKDEYNSDIGLNLDDLFPGAFPEGVPKSLSVLVSALVPQVAASICYPGVGERGDPALPDCQMVHIMPTLARQMETVDSAVRTSFEQAVTNINEFLLVSTFGRMEGLLDTVDDSLDHFNCQFLGTGLDVSVVPGLCRGPIPTVGALGVIAVFLGILGAISAYVTWRSYRYYADLSSLGEIECSEVSAAAASFSEAGKTPPDASKANVEGWTQ